jgi:hypothetical protein
MRDKTKEQYRDELQSFMYSHATKNRLVVECIGLSFEPFEQDDLCAFTLAVPNLASLDVLESCGLAVRRRFRSAVSHGELYVTLVVPTPFGIGFVSACRGDTLESSTGTAPKASS